MIALTRPVPDALASCELTHLARVPIDLAVARSQHAAYERALASLGCELGAITPAHDHADSVFVEDAAIVLDELAVITRPGAVSRRGETAGVAQALSAWRECQWLSAPALLDGGDVLQLGRTLYVGVGARTNAEGATQLAAAVRRHGYTVVSVAIGECLHLKSAATEIAPGLVLVNPQWIDGRLFEGHRRLEVDPLEPGAANVLRIGDTVLCASAYDRTNARLEAAGATVRTVDVSELAKAEAGLTCCSLIFGNNGAGH